MTQGDLFKYPHVPGHRDTDTSREAAEAVQPRSATLRGECLALFRRCNNWTADEMAYWLDESILAIRPRITELNKMGLIKDTGERRPNASGRRAIVWKAT